jgi:hypothetical protein
MGLACYLQPPGLPGPLPTARCPPSPAR